MADISAIKLPDGVTYNIKDKSLTNLVNGSAEGSVRGIKTTVESSSYTMNKGAFAEGLDTKASGLASHAEGQDTVASGLRAHAEGYMSQATGDYSHAEGDNTKAIGNHSHTEGYLSTATHAYAHAEGYNSQATQAYAHAEGYMSVANGDTSHAEGFKTTTSGDYSHAEGASTIASGMSSHAEGRNTIANHHAQHVFGEYNIEDASTAAATSRGNYVEIVGNGSYYTHSNARTLDWSGNEVLAGKLTVGAIGTNSMDVATIGQLPTVPANIVNTITTTAGAHTAISNQKGNVSFNVPTKTSHLTNDSGFITNAGVTGIKGNSESSYRTGQVNLTAANIGATSIDVLPNDNGEIKTKFRITKRGYTGGNTTFWYFPLVKLPIDNGNNAASLIISGRVGGYMSSNMSSINALAWNRNGIGIALLDIAGSASNMNNIWNICDIVIYRNSDDNTAIIYLKVGYYFTFDIDLELYQSTADIIYDGNYQTVEPEGVLEGQASTSTRRVEIVNGKLLVGGLDLSAISNLTGTLAISHGGTGQTTAANAINALLNGLPTWTADPTDTTYFVRQDTGGSATYGKVQATTLWNYISEKLPAWSKASSKPSYNFSEINSKPTTLSGYGITDAKISNGTITLGSNTITPLTSYTETDPVFTASAAHGISTADITNWNSKQAALVSGTNIKTINNQSILGNGNIDVDNIFIVDIGVSTYNDIYQAYIDGKTLFAKDSNGSIDSYEEYWLSFTNYNSSDDMITFSSILDGYEVWASIDIVDNWQYGRAIITPAWAKASTKPTYTASEVGALPASTVIPTKTSDLQNDSNFISTDENGGIKLNSHIQ